VLIKFCLLIATEIDLIFCCFLCCRSGTWDSDWTS